MLNKFSEAIRTNMTKNQRLKIVALVTIEVHSRDIIEQLAKSGCSDAASFEWLKELRFYWDRDIDDCIAKQTSTQFQYGYEYLGNSGRLVITPLTDRLLSCWFCGEFSYHRRFTASLLPLSLQICSFQNNLWYGAGLVISRLQVRIPPAAAVYQRQLSVPSFRGRLMSTSESWAVNGHITRCTSPVCVVLQLRLGCS